MFELLGDVEAAKLVTRLTDWMVATCTQYGGKVVKLLGDGVLMVFGEADPAINAAVAMQRGHQVRLPQWSRELRMHLKIGVASGPVVIVRGDCYGEAVNVAARLSDLAGESQIWVTESVVLESREAGAQARDLGIISVRGLAGGRRVYQIEWDDRPDSDHLTLMGEDDPALVGWALDSAVIELTGKGDRLIFPATRLPIHLGRAAQADMVVHDPRVSRSHARIAWVNGAFMLSDTSSYGTWIRFAGSGSELRLRRGSCMLHGAGEIALGQPFTEPGATVVSFRVFVPSHGATESHLVHHAVQ